MIDVIVIIFLLSMLGVVIWVNISTSIKDSKRLKTLEQKYNVDKFPITSKMGNLYYGKIEYDDGRFCSSHIRCKIYKRTYKSNGKYKDIEVVDRPVDFESVDYSFIDTIAIAVNDYEDINRRCLEKEKYEAESLAKNKKLFAEWDGVIRDGDGVNNESDKH